MAKRRAFRGHLLAARRCADDRFEEILARQIDTPEKFLRLLPCSSVLAREG